MMLVLTCVLCASEAAFPAPVELDPGRPALLGARLSLDHPDVSPPSRPASLTLAMWQRPDNGSGDGEGHSDHMGPMWIVMGAMMAVMMVGMGVYLMRHATSAQAFHPAASPSPAQLAVPVSAPRGGGG